MKRRLASEISALTALRFHRAMQAQLLHSVGENPQWRTWIAITPDITGRTPDSTLINQGRGDLGQRMARCFRALPPGPALLIGSDIPGIKPRHIARAFKLLMRNDVIFGPANDGGYWLIGLKRVRRLNARSCFRGVRWSTPHALHDSCEALGKTARLGFAETLSDVDTAEDYHHWRRLCSSRRGIISTKLQGRKR